jgi:uncharacterized membrane protein
MTDSTGVGGPPTNRMVIAVLSLIGFFICFYLISHFYGWTGPLVCGVGDCGAVQASPYAKIGGIPLSVFGLAGYVLLLGASFVGVQPGKRDSRFVGGVLIAVASFGVCVSGYLTYLEAYVIHAWCQWCVISAVLMTVIFLASLVEIGRFRAHAEETS